MLYKTVPENMTHQGSTEGSVDDLLRLTLASLTEVSFLMHDLEEAVGRELLPYHDPAYQDLARMAHAVLYFGRQLKSLGTGVLNPAVRHRVRERHGLENALREATSSKALSLVFEPIVSSSSGRCHAFEALLRWNHPELGAVSPGEFVPLAERTGDIVAIGRWVLLEACREALTWNTFPAPALSVNISPVQIMAGSFIQDVSATLLETGLPPERLHLELTENLFPGDHKIISSALAELRRSGIRVALDDFGTGFSSLSQLRGLLVDAIKIDRSFTQALSLDSIPIVKAMVSLSEVLGLDLIAEGVETLAQAEALLSVGVPYLQGFLFTGHSLTAQCARDWLAAEACHELFLKTRSALA